MYEKVEIVDVHFFKILQELLKIVINKRHISAIKNMQLCHSLIFSLFLPLRDPHAASRI